MIHFISDCHFWHNNVIKYSNRPYVSVEEMNATLISRWNERVADGDDVWSLGDFAFAKLGQISEILSQLNGNIHMVTGNHDEVIIKNRQYLLDSGLVKEITPYKEVSFKGQMITMFHYGSRVWNKSHYGSWALFGHSHGNLTPYGKSVDVGVDSTFVTGKAEYRPLSFDEIKEFMDNRKIETTDMHVARTEHSKKR